VVAFLATVLLLAIWRPTVVRAQAAPDTTTTSHVVKAGESLWLLAERYYGSGYAWQDLARRNSIVTTRSKVLLVGMKLRVPASVPKQGVARSSALPVPDVATAIAVASPTASPSASPSTTAAARGAPATTSLAAQTVDKADAAAQPPAAARAARARPVSPRAAAAVVAAKPALGSANPARPANPASAALASSTPAAASTPAADAPVKSRPDAPEVAQRAVGLHPQIRAETLLTRQTTRIGLVDREDLRAARAGDVATVFLRRIPEAAEVDAQARALSKADAPAPRRGEYESAPFSIEASVLLKSGRLIRRMGSPSSGTSEEPQRLLIADEVELSAPAGVSLAVGDRLVSVRVTPEVSKGVRVAIPTGVVRVTRVEAGKPILAIVHTQSGNVEQGQAVMLVQGTAAPLSARAISTTSSDVATSVRWIDGAESLPTLQSFVLLGAGSAQGVQAGDEFELRSAAALVAGVGDERIARARVVRVGAGESSAIIVKQDRAEIAIGVAARRVARVP